MRTPPDLSNCMVEYFDSFTMRNRIGRGRLISLTPTSAFVEVFEPNRKRVKVRPEDVRPDETLNA